MKKFLLFAVAMMLMISSVSTASADSSKILKFDTMVGVPRPYTGATNAIRGVPGGGLPWVVGSAEGNLKTNGKLEITVMGLVIDPNDPAAIERGVAGTNPSATFKALVSCLSKDSAGLPITVNIPTAAFPADAAGNSHIETVVSLPRPCIAPIVFVTSGGGSWFAATGF
jgi:hypothetical protein